MRFTDELGSASVYAAVNRHGSVATANTAYAEMYAGMTRKYREGLISQKQYEAICKVIEDEWHAFIVVELDHDILERARDVIKRYPLRGFDAIHLASALTLNRKPTKSCSFWHRIKGSSRPRRRNNFRFLIQNPTGKPFVVVPFAPPR